MHRSRRRPLRLLLALLLTPTLLHAAPAPSSDIEPLDLKFSGYRFGQSPSANMVCGGGYCKARETGDSGRLDLPFSIYETPGALTTLGGLTIVRPRYTFWNDRLYRISFQVNCAPLETEECLDDIVRDLDREYGLTPLSANDFRNFVLDRRQIVRDFVSEAGAIIKIRGVRTGQEWQKPLVDIADRRMADQVGYTLNPEHYKPKKVILP